MYHNRLRRSEFVKLFQEAGVRIEWESRALDQRSLQQLQRGFPRSWEHSRPVGQQHQLRTIRILSKWSTTI